MVLPVADVANFVPNATCGAGATLSVTATGELSTSCPNLSIKKNNFQLGTIYPTYVDTTLNVDLSDSAAGDSIISIFSALGQKVYSSIHKSTASEKITINVANLTKGIYLCNLNNGETETTLKFIKK